MAMGIGCDELFDYDALSSHYSVPYYKRRKLHDDVHSAALLEHKTFLVQRGFVGILG